MIRRYRRTILVVLFVAYVGMYWHLSRAGYADADKYNLCGFYYFLPLNVTDINVWRVKNYGCALVFSPLNYLDRMIGTGRFPAKEPLWGLSR